MNKSRILIVVLVVSLAVLIGVSRVIAQRAGPTGSQAALGQGFSYQGQLKDLEGAPLTTTCDFQFTLWDDKSVGTQVGGVSDAPGVSVADGLFTAPVNAGGEFGATAFTGDARWLQIAVQCSGDADYTTLAGRQALTAAPYATYALTAGSVAWSGVTGAPNFQRRVNGVCAAGSTIRTINSDGSVVCQNDAPLNRASAPMHNQLIDVDSLPGGDTGQYTSITIGADGLPIISFYDVTNQDLRVAHCEQVDCSGAATLTTVDGAGDVGKYSSITIGVDGLPLISYYDVTNGDLKLAHCGDVACAGGANIVTLDNTVNSDVGQYSSIMVAVDGQPIVSYYAMSPTNNYLKVAHCVDYTCSAAPVINVVDSTSVNVGQYTSIAISPSGLAAISYYDAANGDLKLAACMNFDCSSSSINIVDSANDVGQFSSLAFGNDGLPIISYYDATPANLNLRVAHCGDTSCFGAKTTATLYDNGDVGQYSSITIGADGLPVVSFHRLGSGLRVAHCSDIACSSAETYAPVSDTLAGQYTAITLGVDGLPIISFYDGTPQALRTMHCANNFCLSYLRRR